jgi:hydrogenase-4 component B
VVLTLLAILIAALVVLAAVTAFVPRPVVAFGSAGISGLAILLVLAAMAGADGATLLVLPLGTAGVAMHLALDSISLCFLLLVFLAGVPSALFLAAQPDALHAALPASLAAMALIMLAADPFTLVVGLLLLGFALWLMQSPWTELAGAANSAQVWLCLATFGVVCVIAALALAVPRSVAWVDCDFRTIREMPPEGLRASAVLLLTLGGVGSQAAMVYRSGIAVPAATSVWIYVLIRLLLDLCGTAQPSWWGVPLLLIGAIGAAVGILRVSFESMIRPNLSIGSLHQLGLAVVAIGVALLARAVDLPDVALLALEAAWLLLTCHVLCRTLLLLCASAVEVGAGTGRLDRMGGLIHRMKVSTACTLAGLFGVAVLPPGLGFAGFWLLFQSLLAATRIGGLGLQIAIGFVTALMVLSAGLSAFIAIRLFGVAFLGRPRTPRVAVAEEAPQSRQVVLICLAGLTGLLGLLPALALLPARAALAHLANGGLGAAAFALTLRPGAEAPGYGPFVIAALLILTGCAIFWLLQRVGTQEHRQEAAWSGGFAPPPAWLPFGDPATQYGPASFAEPLHRIVSPLLAQSQVMTSAMRAWLVQQRVRLLRAVKAANASRSIATGLAVLVLVMAVWLVML